jgi:hypothetical protein
MSVSPARPRVLSATRSWIRAWASRVAAQFLAWFARVRLVQVSLRGLKDYCFNPSSPIEYQGARKVAARFQDLICAAGLRVLNGRLGKEVVESCRG